MKEIKAKCNQDLFPVWSKYKKSFWEGNVYSFIVGVRHGERIFTCNKNSLNTSATMSESLFNTYFTVVKDQL